MAAIVPNSLSGPWRSLSWVLLGVFALMPSIAEAGKATKLLPYASCFASSAKAHNLTVNLLQAVVATESNWNPRARSHANAHGLMQIQWPGTAKHLGVRRVSQLYRPCTNIELGARYLRELLDRYNNDERRALAAYNYGPGRIAESGPIPKGADKYVATVRRHKKRLGGGQDSLNVRSVKRAAGDFQLWLTGGVSELTADDRTLLTSLGWGA